MKKVLIILAAVALAALSILFFTGSFNNLFNPNKTEIENNTETTSRVVEVQEEDKPAVKNTFGGVTNQEENKTTDDDTLIINGSGDEENGYNVNTDEDIERNQRENPSKFYDENSFGEIQRPDTTQTKDFHLVM